MENHLNMQGAGGFPQWHSKPFLLTCAEMKDPAGVIGSFFKDYDLSLLRITLSKWLAQSRFDRGEDASLFIRFKTQLLRLLEAVYVYRGQAPATGAESVSGTASAREEDKERYFLDLMEDNPGACLCSVFDFSRDDSIKDIIERWFLLAVCSGHLNDYDEGGKRGALHRFCMDVQHLTEAAFAWAQQAPDHSLNDAGPYIHLTEEECAQPLLVFNRFSEKYSLRYARAELWHLLDAVISYDGPEQVKSGNLLFEYEMLLCVIMSAYLITGEPVARAND